ncbi:hypothetical protein LY78DRAFT_694668 [Colletotrichum sublineola]|nr:hypothetical protein LY78DRAFT_694668 [Colletotrichum sublineola]
MRLLSLWTIALLAVSVTAKHCKCYEGGGTGHHHSKTNNACSAVGGTFDLESGWCYTRTKLEEWKKLWRYLQIITVLN